MYRLIATASKCQVHHVTCPAALLFCKLMKQLIVYANSCQSAHVTTTMLFAQSMSSSPNCARGRPIDIRQILNCRKRVADECNAAEHQFARSACNHHIHSPPLHQKIIVLEALFQQFHPFLVDRLSFQCIERRCEYSWRIGRQSVHADARSSSINAIAAEFSKFGFAPVPSPRAMRCRSSRTISELTPLSTRIDVCTLPKSGGRAAIWRSISSTAASPSGMSWATASSVSAGSQMGLEPEDRFGQCGGRQVNEAWSARERFCCGTIFGLVRFGSGHSGFTKLIWLVIRLGNSRRR